MELDLDLGMVATSPARKITEVADIPDIPFYPKMKEGEVAGNYNCVVIDTVNELQNAEYLSYIDPDTSDLMTQKKYANLGVKLKLFVDQAKKYRNPDNNGQAVLILGTEGTGKSYGIKYLDPKKTFWIHSDSKPATFKGASNYKLKNKNYVETTDYNFAKLMLHKAYERRDSSVPFVIFFMGHLDIVDSKNSPEYKEQLKTVGAFAHKLNIEGAFSNCFKTVVEFNREEDRNNYFLDTQNNGHNTIRSQEDLFSGRFIPNNLEYIRQQIINY